MVSKNCITLTTYLNYTTLYKRLTLLQHYLTSCVQSNKNFFCSWLKFIFLSAPAPRTKSRTSRYIKRANAYRRDKCHKIIWASSLLICLERRLRACVRGSSPALTIRFLSVHSISYCVFSPVLSITSSNKLLAHKYRQIKLLFRYIGLLFSN